MVSLSSFDFFPRLWTCCVLSHKILDLSLAFLHAFTLKVFYVILVQEIGSEDFSNVAGLVVVAFRVHEEICLLQGFAEGVKGEEVKY